MDRDESDHPHVAFSERVESVEPSPIREMFKLARARTDADLVHLEIGEPDFDTPERALHAAQDAMWDGETHYTANAGVLALREAIAERASRQTGATIDGETQVSVTSGSMEALLLALLTAVDAGDEVVIPTPAWPNYRAQTRIAGGVPVEAPLSPEDSFSIDASRIEAAASDDTAAILLPNPANPTGRIPDVGTIERLIDAARAHDAFLIVDEVYEGLVYTDAYRRAFEVEESAEHVVVVNSCSKKYAMTGWRVGWLLGHPDFVSRATKLHESTTSCAASVSQHAALAAISGDDTALERMKEAFRERRKYVLQRIEDAPLLSCTYPEGAFYAFIDVSDLDGASLDVAKRLLREHDVVTVPGSGFGRTGEGYVRISFANDRERIGEGLDRLEQMVRSER